MQEQETRHNQLVVDLQKRTREEIVALEARYKKSITDH